MQLVQAAGGDVARYVGGREQRAEARKFEVQAAQYFNFLINRELEAEIEIDLDRYEQLPVSKDVEETIRHALNYRDEFRQMQSIVSAMSHQVGLTKGEYLPSVLAVVDYGIQGEEYRLGGDHDYWMASLVFDWTLFSGRQRQARKAQAREPQYRPGRELSHWT